AAGASARPRCRPSLTQSHWRRRNSWPLDHRRQLHWLNQPAASVRPSLDYYSYGKKTVVTDTGTIELAVPRDRQASFDPQLIAKYQRRFPGFDDKIVSMYA